MDDVRTHKTPFCLSLQPSPPSIGRADVSVRPPAPQIRHLAAITLKKRILVLWQGLSDQAKDATKAALLDRIIKEPKCAIRASFAISTSSRAAAAPPTFPIHAHLI